MSDILDVLGAANSHGAGLVLLGWIVWEVRRMRSDFSNHQHDRVGRTIVVAREG